MSLRKKTVTGLLWTFGQQFSVQLITFVTSIILARVLAPAEFGLIAMISLFMSLGHALMDTGLTSSLIRTQDADHKDYSTVFFINLVGSIIIYIILFFSAPLIAAFYEQPILTQIIRVYTISFVIDAFSSVQKTRLTKAMNFKTEMTIQVPSIIIGGILGITLAYLGWGVWSLIYMYLFQSLLSTIQLWIVSGWKPELRFYKDRYKYHFSFGWKMTASGLLETLYQNLYILIIGKAFSATQLGYYSRAFSLRQLPISNLSKALNKVSYPMFSSINHDEKKLKTAYQKLMQQLLFWLCPILIFAVVYAEPFIRFLLTEKWLPAVPYFQILALAGIMYPINFYNTNILKVKGRSDLHMRLQIIKKSYAIISVLCIIPYGIMALLYFQLVSSIIDFFINTFYSGRMINYPVSEQLADILPVIGLSALFGGISWLLKNYLVETYQLPDLAVLAIGAVFYFLTYLGCSNVIKLPAAADFKQLVLKAS